MLDGVLRLLGGGDVEDVLQSWCGCDGDVDVDGLACWPTTVRRGNMTFYQALSYLVTVVSGDAFLGM
jgi:hypothetical protein